MTLKWRRKIILFKTEASYGVDPAPTGAANALLVNNAQLTPMEGEDVARENETPFMGADAMIPVGLRGRLTGRIELVGSGAAGTAPAWGPLMLALGCSEAILPATSVTYTPVSEGHASGTLHFWMDGTQHVLTGCRGTGVFRFPAQGIPYLEFDILGLWTKPTEEARPTPDLSAYAEPEIVTDAKTPTFTINGVDMVMRECALTMNNQVVPRLLVNSEAILITDRAETVSARVEATPVTTFDPYALAEARTKVPLNLVHGTTAGRIATFNAPSCQLKRLSGYENADNIAEWPLELTPLQQSGDDQWTLALT